MEEYFKIIENNFGKVLRNIRIDKGLSQTKVAGQLMGQSSIVKIENGEMRPSYLHYLQIAYNLDISIDEFTFALAGFRPDDKTRVIDYLSQFEYHGDVQVAKEALAFCENCYKESDDTFFFYMKICIQGWIHMMENQDLNMGEELTRNLELLWNHLIALDKWYVAELCMLSVVILAFPFEHAIQIGQEALDMVNSYNNSSEQITNVRQRLISALTFVTLKNNKYDVTVYYADMLLDNTEYNIPGYRQALVLINRGLAYYSLGKSSLVEHNIKQGVIMLVSLGNEHYYTMRRQFLVHYRDNEIQLLDRIHLECVEFLKS